LYYYELNRRDTAEPESQPEPIRLTVLLACAPAGIPVAERTRPGARCTKPRVFALNR
jgi:hypothetical protein